MKVKHLVAIVAVLSSAGSALAQRREFVAADEGFVSTKSQAELRQAKASGAYVIAGSEEYARQFAARHGGTWRGRCGGRDIPVRK
jgi:hypothetical protein